MTPAQWRTLAEKWKGEFGPARVLAAALQDACAQSERQDMNVRALYKQRRAAEKERDEWQELAVRLAEEAGVDAEQMLAQARAEAKP